MNGKRQGARQQSQSAPDEDETIVSLDPESGITDRRRRRLLLRRFWQRRRRLLGRGRRAPVVAVDGGDPAADPPQPGGCLRHERLAPGDFRRPGEADSTTVFSLSLIYFPAAGGERRAGRRPGLCPHDDAAALASLAEPSPARPLADQRPLLSAQPGAAAITRIRNTGSPTTSGWRSKRRSTSPPGVTDGGPVGGDLHRRALDDRRLAHVHAGRHDDHHSGLSGGRRGALCGARERLDGFHRPPLRHRVGEQEPGRSGVSLRAHAPARERREHRACSAARTRSATASTAH